MRPLLDRCQSLLLLLADLLRLVRLPAAALMPLLRACMVSLAVEGQKLLQEKAVRLLVAAFQAYPAQVGAQWGGCKLGGRVGRWADRLQPCWTACLLSSARLPALLAPFNPPPSLPAPLPTSLPHTHSPSRGHMPPLPPTDSPATDVPPPPPPLQWGALLEELFAHVMPHLAGGPRAPRDFPASEDARTCIQMLTAAVLQMIQVPVVGGLPACLCVRACVCVCGRGCRGAQRGRFLSCSSPFAHS